MVALFFHLSYQKTPNKVLPTLTGVGTHLYHPPGFSSHIYSHLLLILLSLVYFNSLSGYYFKKMGEEKPYDQTILY